MEIKTFRSPYPFEIHSPAGSGPFGVIFITPLLGRLMFVEDLYFERYFAKFLAKHGFACIIPHRDIFEFNPSQSLEQLQHYIETSLAKNRAILQHALENPSLDKNRVGTFGISFGAVLNCLWAGQDKIFKSHLLALPGGNLPEIFMRSRDPLMRSYFDAASKHSGLVGEELLIKLKEIFKLDPLNCHPHCDNVSILMILALFDRIIPYRYGQELRDLMGKPETIYLPLGHVTSLAAIPLLLGGVAKFYKNAMPQKLTTSNTV